MPLRRLERSKIASICRMPAPIARQATIAAGATIMIIAAEEAEEAGGASTVIAGWTSLALSVAWAVIEQIQSLV